MTLSSAYIELVLRGKSSDGNVRGEMSKYPYNGLRLPHNQREEFCRLIFDEHINWEGEGVPPPNGCAHPRDVGFEV